MQQLSCLALAALAVALVPSDGAAAQACRQDPATALSMPTRAAGVCVGTVHGEAMLVQRSRQGLLIVALASDASARGDAEEGETFLHLHQSSPRVIYCPAALLDFGSGDAGADCLAPGDALTPGARALVGAGSVQASLRLDGNGNTTCPTASRVVASVVSPEGSRFDLTGSLSLFEEPGAPGTCADPYDRVELDYHAAAAPDVPDAPDASPERARRIQRLLELDEQEWQAVELMLALTPGDWAILDEIVKADGGGAPASAGAVDFGAASGGSPDPVLQSQTVFSLLNGIITRINAVRANVDGLVSRIPDRPDVRGLVGQIDLTHLRGVMDDVRDTLGGLVAIARELREGYDTFDAPRFRERLGRVLEDVGRLSTLYQRLLCIDNPDLTPRAPSGQLLRRLIDRVPGVVLYGLSKVLESVRGDWDTLVADIVDAVPAELTEFCNDGVAMRALSVDPESAICVALRPKGTNQKLLAVRANASLALLLFRAARNNTKEQIAVTAGANVVAGATVGTVVKNPVYEVAESWVERLENIKELLEKVTDLRKDCLDADADIEGDLRDCAKDGCACSVPLSVLLDGATAPSYTYVARLVETRIDQAESAGVGDAAAARDFWAIAEDDANVGTAAGYTALCQAYASLLPATTPTSGASTAGAEGAFDLERRPRLKGTKR
ncbi:MAG TPA: hypothetical protein VF139_11205 [Candidatus Polarisedimenticolaceae bacterium]